MDGSGIVLIIEKDEVSAGLRAAALEGAGFETAILPSWAAALDGAARRDRGIALVLADLALCRAPGSAAAARALIGQLDAIVLFLAARAEWEAGQPIEGLGSQVYVERDASPDSLVAAARMAVELGRAKGRLASSEDRFRLIVENTKELVCEIDERGRFSYLSPSHAAALGYEPDDLIGLRAADLIHPEERGSASDRIFELASPGDSFRETRRILRRDGSWGWFDCSGTAFERVPGELHRVIVSRDVTELNRSKEAVRYQSVLIEKSPFAIIATDADLRITVWNPAAGRIYGWTETEALGRRASELLGTHYRPEEREADRRSLSERGTWTGTLTQTRKDGAPIALNISISEIRDDAGTLTGLVGIAEDVTELRATQEALRRTNAELAKVQRIAKIGSWSRDPATGRTMWSDEMYELYGVPPTLAGEELFAAIGARIHPEDREAVQEWRRRIAVLGEPSAVEFRVVLADGTERVLWSEAAAFSAEPDGFRTTSGFTQDITAFKAAQRAIAAGEERFRKAIEYAPHPIMLRDESGGVISVNRRWTELTGYTIEDIPTLSAWFEKAYGLHASEVGEMARSTYEREGIVRFGVLEVNKRDGGTAFFDFSWAPLGTIDGGGRLVMVMAVDVTERVLAERGTEDRQRALIQTEKMASIGVLVAGVAHEINSPNQAIRLNASLLSDVWDSARPALDQAFAGRGDELLGGLEYRVATEKVPGLFRGIEAASRHIADIVKGLRDFSRGDDEKAELESVDLNAVAQAAASLLRPFIDQATDCFRLDLDPGLPPAAGRFQKLEQVAVNLLQNACQALFDRSQAVVLSTGVVEGGDRVRLEVRDEGTGMTEEVLSRIKDPFFTTKRGQGGVGLGLSISAAIVEDCGGRLDFVSESGRGTSAIVVLSAYGRAEGAATGGVS